MAGEFRVDAEEQAELNRNLELRKRNAVQQIQNLNPEGGVYVDRSIQEQLDTEGMTLIRPEEDYHGQNLVDQTVGNVTTLLSGASNQLEKSRYGRNFKRNWSDILGTVGRVGEYMVDESTRGGQSTPGEWLSWGVGNFLRDREKYTEATGNALSQIKIGDKGIDPRIIKLLTGEVIDTLATGGLAGISKTIAKTAGKLPPPPTGLALATVGGGKVNVSSLARQADEFKPSNVLQINAAHPQALGKGKPWSQPQADAGRTIRNKEYEGKPQTSKRSEKAQWGTDYTATDHNLYNEKYLRAKNIGESHHAGDHDFVGSISQELGDIRGPTLLKNLQKRNVRSGNDAMNMVTIPGKGKGAGARYDHVGLMHKRWYPQITSRQQIMKAIEDGSIHSMSDKRIADLTASTIKTQQRVTIGWAKWKLDTVRKLYPETMYYKPKQMRTWLENNPQKFAAAGGKNAPMNYEDIMNYGRTKGQDNYSNAWLREVFDIEYGSRNAALGKQHQIPSKHRQKITPTGGRKTGKH